jgi:outer membrane protein assembly factor BamB
VRRLVYREAWRKPAAGALRLLPFAPGPLLIELPGQLEARDAETGTRLWKADAAPGAVARGPELFFAEPGDALVRIEVVTGEVRWKRRMRGAESPAQLWALAGGVLRSLPGEGLCLVSDAGTLSFRTRLPGGAPSQVAAVDRVLVAALGSGSLAGLDPSDARVLWKRRFKASALIACGPRALALSAVALACIDPHSGTPFWEREVPEESFALTVSEGSAVLLGAGGLLAFSLADGAPRPAQPLPWARFLTAADEPEVLIASGANGALARLTGKRWEALPDGESPPSPAQLQRGVVLSRGASTLLYDAAEGLVLAQLPPAREAALAPDLSCALIEADEVSMHRLTAHLSLL